MKATLAMKTQGLPLVFVVAVAAMHLGCAHESPLQPRSSLVITSVSPQDGDTTVSVSTTITIAFSQPLSWRTAGAEDIAVFKDSAPVRGTAAVSDNVVVYTPAEPLDYDQAYTVTVSTALKSSDSATLEAPYRWSFKTRSYTWDAGSVLDVSLQTYDGSGQAIHPSVLYFANGFQGWHYVMAITPYPHANGLYENPSIYVSADGIHWTVPPGLANPVVVPGDSTPVTGIEKDRLVHARPTLVDDRMLTPAFDRDDEAGLPFTEIGLASLPYHTGVSGGYLSDPHLVYMPQRDAVRLYFRQASGPMGYGDDVIFFMESADLVSWGNPQEIMRGPHATIISPAVVFRNNRWEMWSIEGLCGSDNTMVRYTSSADGEDNWSPFQNTNLVQPGYVIWHIDVDSLPDDGYGALYNAYPAGAGSCVPGDLFFARGSSALSWQAPQRPFLQHVGLSEFPDGLYRSSFFVAADTMYVWLSGFSRDAQGSYLPHAGALKLEFSHLLASLNRR